MHKVTLHYITLHYITLHCIVLHCIALHCIVLHCAALRCVALRCVTLRYVTLRYVTLRYVRLPYITQINIHTGTSTDNLVQQQIWLLCRRFDRSGGDNKCDSLRRKRRFYKEVGMTLRPCSSFPSTLDIYNIN